MSDRVYRLYDGFQNRTDGPRKDRGSVDLATNTLRVKVSDDEWIAMLQTAHVVREKFGSDDRDIGVTPDT